MAVDFVHRELADVIPQYNIIRDCVIGEVAVKAKRTAYLPMPNPEDTSKENVARYEAYKTRAVFYNVTRRTLAGLVGQVVLKDPVIKVPALLDAVVKDTNGRGLTAFQMGIAVHRYVTQYGRAGIFTDFPRTEGATTREQQEKGEVRPTIVIYSPYNIINWKYETINGKSVLSLVVLMETYDESEDEFEETLKNQYRVLRLKNGIYEQEIWRDNQIYRTAIQPKDGSGNLITEIPFTFVGSENNDATVDAPPLYDLASINLAHYRNSADHEESTFITGQPTLVLSGLTEAWVKDVLGGAVQMGASTSISLPVGAKGEILQAEANTLTASAMEAKERQMVALGAKLVEQKTVQRTATESSIDNAAESSQLTTITNNVSDAVQWSFEWAAIFAGAITVRGDAVSNGIEYRLNTDFDISKGTPEQVKTAIKAWQDGAISFTEMRNAVKRSGMATQDDAKAKQEIETDEVKEAEMFAATAKITGEGETGNE